MWADKYIEELRQGRAVTFRPRGRSMEGRIEDNQLVLVVPLYGRTPKIGDIVLCTVGGRQYLHLIKDALSDFSRFQIANNKGHVNGWCRLSQIHGLYTPTAEARDAR